MKRDDFTKPIKTKAHQRVAGRCSNPQCRAPTFAPTGGSDVSNVGVGAHIHAAAPGGPRYLASMGTAERRGFGNIIWLCQTCSTIIDRDPNLYTAEVLHKWKETAEAKALLEQGKPPLDERGIYRMAAMAMGNRVPGFYPEAIGNVHRALADQLESIDPRFSISTSYVGENTTITVSAKEPVSFSIKIGQESAEAWRKGLQAAIDEGREETMPLYGVSFEGSDLFRVLHNDANSASITIIPATRPALLKIMAQESDFSIFECISGQISAGRKQIRFSGSGFGDLIKFSTIYTLTADSRVNTKLTLTTNPKAWHGKEASNPPYLDAIIKFLEKLFDPSISITFALEIEGSTVSTGKLRSFDDKDSMKEILWFAYYARRARTVLQFLGRSAPIDIFTIPTADEYEALARASEIIEGKLSYQRSEINNLPVMTITCEDGGIALKEVVAKKGAAVLKQQGPESTITIYGQKYKTPPATSYLSPVRLHILSRKKIKNAVEFKMRIEMEDNFTYQTYFEVQ
jgi:hypothetical protein